jgi:Protein of unknown function (DUF3738).
MRATMAIMLTMAAHAQQPPGARVEFEVVSVKPGDPADPGSYVRTTPGGLQLRNTTLKNLVRSAYDLNEYQVDGGPKWLNSAKFAVDAKLPAGVPRDQIPLMLQAMLTDRFKLEFHHVTRTLNEYALVSCPGDFVRADAAGGIGVGPAKGLGRLGVGADIFAEFVAEI